MKMTHEEALTFLRQGLSRIAYWDGGTCICEHCPSCEARALLIHIDVGGDLSRALSSCVCEEHVWIRAMKCERCGVDYEDMLVDWASAAFSKESALPTEVGHEQS